MLRGKRNRRTAKPRISISRPGQPSINREPTPELLDALDQARASVEPLRQELEELSARLKDLILQQPPKDLLAFLWSLFLMSRIGAAESSESGDLSDAPVHYALEYVHAVLSSFQGTPNSATRLDEHSAHEIVEL